MYPELFNIDFNGFLGLGTITISSYAVCIVLGVVLATLYGKRAAKKELNIHISNNFIYLLFIAGYVGGKVFLYLEKPFYYINNPSTVLNTFSSGFVFYGSFLFVVPTTIWYFKKHKFPVYPLLDIAAISVVIIQIIGRIGCFFAGCCYGKPTESVLGVSFTTTHSLHVHPTQLYESALLSIFLIFLFILKNNKKFSGQLFLLYLGYYGISRYIIELFRGDERGQIIEGLLSHSQGIAIVLISISIITYYKLNQILTKKQVIMKNVFKNSILPALFCAFATIIIGMGCSPSDTAEENYENTPPDIIVISPNSGDIFFTLGGEDAPDFINIEAVFEAADGIDLDEEVSTAIIYDADNNVVYTCNISEATNSSGKAILNVNDRFETHNTGPYRIVFTAINEAQPIINEEGAKRTAEIYVDCNPSETDTN